MPWKKRSAAGRKSWWRPCPHGAERLSRGAAKRRFTAEQTAGSECRKDARVIDEIPAAYEPIDEMMDRQSDLAEPVHRLKQVLNVKG